MMDTLTDIPYGELRRLFGQGKSVLLIIKTDIHGSIKTVTERIRQGLYDDWRTLEDAGATRFMSRENDEVEGRLTVSMDPHAVGRFDEVIIVDNPVSTQVAGEQFIKFELRPRGIGMEALQLLGPPWGEGPEPERCFFTCTPAQFGLFAARLLSETGYRKDATTIVRQVMTIRRTAPEVPEYDITTKEV